MRASSYPSLWKNAATSWLGKNSFEVLFSLISHYIYSIICESFPTLERPSSNKNFSFGIAVMGCISLRKAISLYLSKWLICLLKNKFVSRCYQQISLSYLRSTLMIRSSRSRTKWKRGQPSAQAYSSQYVKMQWNNIILYQTKPRPRDWIEKLSYSLYVLLLSSFRRL